MNSLKSYPAGFVYIFSLLYKITNNGENIRLAQYIFMGLYIVTLIVILNIYKKSKTVNIQFFIYHFSFIHWNFYIKKIEEQQTIKLYLQLNYL